MFRILKIATLFLAFILIGCLSAYFTLSFIIKREKTVLVPDLTGKDIVYVLELLTNMGLNTKVKGFDYSVEIPKNYIIFQDPEAGIEIKKGRDVNLVLSKGSEMVIMPNLIGMNFQKARIILEENDLSVRNIAGVYTKSLEPDEVFAQFPISGTRIPREGYADILISKGIRTKAFKMPSLEGFPMDQAILSAEDMQLTIGNIKSVYRKNIPLNVVIDHEPMDGYRVWPGTSVNLVINRIPGTKDETDLKQALGIGLFYYRMAPGFLKRHIQIRFNLYDQQIEIIDDYIKPGEEIWVLVPQNRDTVVLLYEDERLVETQVF